MERLRQALIFMEVHLTEALTVERIAAEAGLSPAHFCRYFRRVRGETVMGYLRRRRLTRAANRLCLEEIRLIDLALESGFESQQAFHRAFKRAYGVTPGAFRRAKGQSILRAPGPCPPLEKDCAMTSAKDLAPPRIEDCPPRQVVGLTQTIAPRGQSEIPGLWRRFRGRYPEIEAKVEGRVFGLCYGHSKNGFTYMAGAEVTAGPKVTLPEGLSRKTVPAGSYAIFTVPITGPDLSARLLSAFNHIFGTWLPASDYESGDDIDYELYDERFDPAQMTGEIDLYIPVKAKP